MCGHGLAVGFTLATRAGALVRGAGRAVYRVRALAAGKLAEIEERLARMIELRDGLRATLKEWNARLAGTKEGGRAGLLETLAAWTAVRSGGNVEATKNGLKRMRRRRI